MKREELAALLVAADSTRQTELLNENQNLCDIMLARELKSVCYESWTSKPHQVFSAAKALDTLSSITNNPEFMPYAEWANAIAALIDGQLEETITQLNNSEKHFIELNKQHDAATTQISKLYVLALLGRYDEAIECGLKARDVFLEHQDIYSAGKVEHNIGGIYSRRDLYKEAESYLESAQRRFSEIGHTQQLTMVENSLAIVFAAQNNFHAAETLFKQALSHAVDACLFVTQAEIEGSIGNLYLFEGRYDLALGYLERSRRKYDSLSMPHQSATTELEIADIYLELNLLPEAVSIYERVEKKFAELGMKAERARCLMNQAKALLLAGEKSESQILLQEAEKLFETEGNPIAAANIKLTKAQLLYSDNKFAEAKNQAKESVAVFAEGGNQRLELSARWFCGELELMQKNYEDAAKTLEEVKQHPCIQSQPQVLYSSLASLGKLAVKNNENSKAENYFKRAIGMIEDARSLLPAEDFRTAFLTNKLIPYNEMLRLSLKNGNTQEALQYLERSRSRTLLETMSGALQLRMQSNDRQENQMFAKLEEVREELNWYYSRMNRQSQFSSADRNEVCKLYQTVKEREQNYLDLLRRLQHQNTVNSFDSHQFDIKQLQEKLGDERALIEYAALDDELLAFVITKKDVVAVNLAHEGDVDNEIKQLRFQLKTMRFDSELIKRHKQQLFSRTLSHLKKLYDLLLRPLEALIGNKHLVVVPFRSLHYLPFQSLHDGDSFLVESREISYAPSSTVLLRCLSHQKNKTQRAALFGIQDKRNPHVIEEINSICSLFDSHAKFINEEATPEAIKENISEADLLHLACHGTFRHDNPLFSSLHLSHGNLTVRDIYSLNLQSKLVTLSACETGMSSVLDGEELLGFVRGFLSAGASSLLMSLWAVNDESTMKLMRSFYQKFCGGESMAKSLQLAQIEILKSEPHPYFWSPFVSLGSW